MAKTTKPKGATTYKETAFGILPRSKLIPLEAQGTKKALDYIVKLSDKQSFSANKKVKVTPELIKNIHQETFNTQSEGLKRERQIKGWSREKKIQVLNLKLLSFAS